MKKVQSFSVHHSSVYFKGPPLDNGPLPAVFYFSLAGYDSLTLDPFNQPTTFLEELPVRVFSMTIPGHGDDLPKENAMGYWAEQISNGTDIITPFIQEVISVIDHLILKDVIDAGKIAVAGLSRGGFIATLVAANHPQVSTILGYAPLTHLETIKEFDQLLSNPLTQKLSLKQSIPHLMRKKLRFYIGSRDKRVSTEHAFHFITALADYAFHQRDREGSFELILTNSIGHSGHGTSKETFHEGVLWLKAMLQL